MLGVTGEFGIAKDYQCVVKILKIILALARDGGALLLPREKRNNL
jgi:hypothetical protein